VIENGLFWRANGVIKVDILREQGGQERYVLEKVESAKMYTFWRILRYSCTLHRLILRSRDLRRRACQTARFTVIYSDQ
jgi:hypothetical protein